MAISDYEVRLLTSVYGIGRAEAKALGETLNAIEAGPVPESVSLAARRAVMQLANQGYSTVEAARLLYAIDNIVAGTPDAEQDTVVVNLLLKRLKIGAALSEPALLVALYTEPAPPGAGYVFANEALVFDDDDGTLSGMAGATDNPTRTQHDFTMPAGATPGGASQIWYAGNDAFLTSGGFILAVDSKVGWEVEFLELPSMTGTGADTNNGVQAKVSMVFAAADDFAMKAASFGILAMGGLTDATTNLSYDPPTGSNVVTNIPLASAVGKRVGFYVDATANAGVGEVGIVVDGTKVAAFANLSGWTAGDRIIPILMMEVQIGTNATLTGNLRVRVCNGAANMNGTGMPAGVKDVAGVAV